MRISDWSSDVCSSDLPYHTHAAEARHQVVAEAEEEGGEGTEDDAVHVDRPQPPEGELQGSTQVVGKIEQGRDGDAHRRGQHQPEHAPVEPQPDEPAVNRTEEHTSELQSLMRNSYAVFCLN